MARTYHVELREQMPTFTLAYKQVLITFNSSTKSIRDEIIAIGERYRDYLSENKSHSVVIYKVSNNRINGVQNMTLVGSLNINRMALMWRKRTTSGMVTINLDEPAHKGVVRVYTN